MRIAFISYEFPPDTGKGGIGTYTRQVSEMLADAGWQVHVFAGGNRHYKEQPCTGLVIHRISCDGPADFNSKLLSVFSSVHQQQNFDVMECPEIHTHAKQIKLAYPKIPLVVRLHAPNWLVENLKQAYLPLHSKLRFVLGALRRGRLDAGYWRRYRFEADAERQFAFAADGITAPSASMQQWAVKHWRLKPQRISILPNPFNAPQALLALPVLKAGTTPHIVFFGRLNVLKGLVNASYAIKKILNEYPDCKFTVIGDDGPGPGLNKSMRKWMLDLFRPVSARVVFIDGLPYDELPAAIADASICVLPSLFESFSYACAEAMAAGKAVIGSKKTGMEDMLQHVDTGILIDASKPGSIYNALKQLLADDTLRYRMAVNARSIIKEKYTSGKMAHRYQDYYKKLIELHAHH